jgi:hypothetical protein
MNDEDHALIVFDHPGAHEELGWGGPRWRETEEEGEHGGQSDEGRRSAESLHGEPP